MNTPIGTDKDGFPIYGFDYKLVAGLRVGKLTILGPSEKPRYWKCQCDCGAVVEKRTDNIKAGATRGGPAGQKNKGCRSCGTGACDTSGIKNRNTAGQIKSKHTETNVGGAKIIAETDYIDMSNRSNIIVCECSVCGKPFYTTRRSESTTCGCTSGRPRKTFEEFIQQRGCRSLGELKVMEYLDSAGISYIQEKKFADCADINPLPFDFMVRDPIHGIYIIEFDGEQHFRPIGLFGGEEKFNIQRKHDLMKNRYCWNNGIRIIRIPTLDFAPALDLHLDTTSFEITPENEGAYYAR